MEKEFIPYKQALALKELGFDEPCLTSYNPNHDLVHVFDISEEIDEDLDENFISNSIIHDNFVSAPLWQQAFKWFRETHNLQHEITRQGTNYWLLTIIEIGKVTTNGIFNGKKYDLDDEVKNEPRSYEEAELECLKKLIEIVKAK